MNTAGVVGVCWNVKIVSARFLDIERRGGTTANAIRAINYLIDLKQRGLNLVATRWAGRTQ